MNKGMDNIETLEDNMLRRAQLKVMLEKARAFQFLNYKEHQRLARIEWMILAPLIILNSLETIYANAAENAYIGTVSAISSAITVILIGFQRILKLESRVSNYNTMQKDWSEVANDLEDCIAVSSRRGVNEMVFNEKRNKYHTLRKMNDRFSNSSIQKLVALVRGMNVALPGFISYSKYHSPVGSVDNSVNPSVEHSVADHTERGEQDRGSGIIPGDDNV